MGTSGREQATYFGAAFQRALGTFREPSHLAAWLMLPLLLCIRKPGYLFGAPLVTMTLATLLTGSITGLGSLAAALGFSLLFFGWRSARVLGTFAAVVFVVAVSIGVYDLASRATGASDNSFTSMVEERLTPVLEEGSLRGSNREFAYLYLDTLSPGPVGIGWGNANLKYSQDSGSLFIGAFQSLYLNALLSTGYIGLTALLIALAWPLARSLRAASSFGVVELTAASAGYVAWLVCYVGLSEELTVSFAMALALLAWRNRLGMEALASKGRTAVSAPGANASETAN